MASARPTYFLRTAMVGMIGLISLLFFPFAGFTEATAYAPSAIYREYGMVGLGTFGVDFNLFGYPGSVGVSQILTLILALGLIYPIWRCWQWYKDPESVSAAAVRLASRITIGIAAAFVLVVAVALLALFPGVEDQTVWMTGTAGYVVDWWPAYGAFVSALAIGGMAVALALRVNRSFPEAPPRAVPPPPPPPTE